MTKRLHLLLFLFIIGLGTTLRAQRTVNLGYCPDELTENAYVQKLSESYSATFQAAIRIPAARLQVYKGATIKKIRVATSEGLTGVYVWIRPSFTEAAINGITRLGTTVEGWNEVELNTPYTITGDEILIGYNGTAPAAKGLMFDGTPNPNACFVNNGGSEWTDLYKYSSGSLCIQAVIEVENDIPTNDVALESCTFDQTFAPVDSVVQATFTIGNYGDSEAQMPKLYYRIGTGEAVSIETEGTLASGESASFTAPVSTKGCTEGYNTLHAWIEAEDSYAANNELDQQIACYATSFPRKVLIEHFTTLPCTNCPAGLRTLLAVVDGRDDYVWVAHHVGYSTDELTVSESSRLTYFGVNGAPMAMFDRTVLDCSDSNKYPTFSIGYSSATVGKEALMPSYLQCAQTPAFVSVNIENTYDRTTRQLTTTVSGQRNSLLETFYPENSLTVELFENGVTTKGIQVGSGSQTHNHVFRASLTDIMGDAIEWDGDTYTRTFTYTLPETWNESYTRVAAFVNRTVSGDYTAGEVLNAADAPVDAELASIGSVSYPQAQVLSRSYYNLKGQRINAPVQGVYLEKTETTEGVSTVKRIK